MTAAFSPAPPPAAKAGSIILHSSRRSSRRPSRVLTPSLTSRSLDATLPGYTVIDIRSIPSSRVASPERPALTSPTPRKNALNVDTAQLMAAAHEEDVSPRTALFLAMKAKAKAEKRQRKHRDRAQQQQQQEEKQCEERPPVRRPHAGSTSVSASLSSSLHSLSLDPELSSLSASQNSDADDPVQSERRMKAREGRRTGYKLCRVSGCLEARAKDGHRKYCRAHQGIHTQGNPNERKNLQHQSRAHSGGR